uniref:Splicing factor, arginine/serine-rich 3 n=1 Tax=Salmo salar TaxID=8030 RepID=B5X9A7_SALSA|nr:Splicing factor, arginine/serine-rich 3 [Salmo salar]
MSYHSSSHSSSPNTNCKVYVGDIVNGATMCDLEREFSQYGPLRSVWVARPPVFGFVEYANVSARGVEVVGADHGLVPAPGHVAAVIDPVPAAMTTGTAPHLIPDRGRGLASLCGPSPVHLLGVVPDLQARKRPTPGED